MTTSIIDKKFVKTIIEKRRKEIHKGDCGRILIAAGSEGMMILPPWILWSRF